MRYTTVNTVYTLVIERAATVCRRVHKVAKMRLLASSCVCPSVRIEQVGLHWTDLQEILYLSIFRKFVEKIQVLLRSNRNNEQFTCSTPVHSSSSHAAHQYTAAVHMQHTNTQQQFTCSTPIHSSSSHAAHQYTAAVHMQHTNTQQQFTCSTPIHSSSSHAAH